VTPATKEEKDHERAKQGRRLAAHAANYAAAWSGGVSGWIYDDNHFQFAAEGLIVEVLRVENGRGNGKDGWDCRVMDADSVTRAVNEPDDRRIFSDTAVRDAWIDFTRLVRATDGADQWEHDIEDGDLLQEALRVIAEKHKAAANAVETATCSATPTRTGAGSRRRR
jgi:hypothetical protein